MKKGFTKRILFVGIPDMAFVCLEACYQMGINIVGVLGPKPTHNAYSAFKKFVLKKNLNFVEYNDLNCDKFIDTIKELKIDLAVVCSFNYKIPKKLLDIPKDGFINLHPSLLPAYRGPNPYSAVIINDEKTTGVTIHHMNEEFDKGDIILQKKCIIDKNETMGTLFNKTNNICVELLIATLEEYEKRTLPRIPQADGNYPIAKNIEDKDTFIDFNKTAIEIERTIRALNPFLLASSVFRKNIVKIMKAKTIEKDFSKDIPNGSIVKIKNDEVWIKTNKGCITFEILQYESYFIGNTKDFIKIVKPKIGERFY